MLVRLTDVLSIRKCFHRTSIQYARASKRRRPGRSTKAEKHILMKEAFYNYAGLIRRTKLPSLYKIGFCRNRHLRLRASKSLRVATGVIILSVLSDVQERLTVMVHQKKGISTSHYSTCIVLQKLKKVLLS